MFIGLAPVEPITLASMHADDNSLGEMVYFLNHWLWEAANHADGVQVEIDSSVDVDRKMPDMLLKNVPFAEAVNRLAWTANLDVRYEDQRIVFTEKAVIVEVESAVAETNIPFVTANLRWMVAGAVACAVGVSFWVSRRVTRA